MLQHMTQEECGAKTIEFTNEWQPFEAGVYRYGECEVCGQRVREYYAYKEIEAITSDGEENIVLHKR